MRIVTNQGSNLHPELVAYYDLDLVSQEICVDEERHDTRAGIELDRVDEWVRNARKHPFVLGTSAAQLVQYFVEVAKKDRELLFVASSRKIIGTYDSAVLAARNLRNDRRYADLDIRVVDTGMTDVGAALPVLLAGQALRQGESLDQIEARVSEMVRHGRMILHVSQLDSLIKGGRATFLQSWLANLLRVRPLLGFDEGELQAIARVPTREDETLALARHLREAVPGDRIWAGIAHGNDPGRARRVVKALQQVFEVEYVYALPLSSSIYLHTGPDSVTAAVFPAPSDLESPPALTLR